MGFDKLDFWSNDCHFRFFVVPDRADDQQIHPALVWGRAGSLDSRDAIFPVAAAGGYAYAHFLMQEQ